MIVATTTSINYLKVLPTTAGRALLRPIPPCQRFEVTVNFISGSGNFGSVITNYFLIWRQKIMENRSTSYRGQRGFDSKKNFSVQKQVQSIEACYVLATSYNTYLLFFIVVKKNQYERKHTGKDVTSNIPVKPTLRTERNIYVKQVKLLRFFLPCNIQN